MGNKLIRSAAMSFEKRNKVFTLAFITKGDQVLLGLKKRGFGEGKINGFGGKQNVGETIEECCVREIEEECSLRVDKKDLIFVGINEFEFVNDPVVMEVHIFKINIFKGEPKESQEMLPAWYPLPNIPYHSMWIDDEIWYPLFLQDNVKFRGYFLFEGHSKILSYKITDFDDTSLVLKQQN